MLMTSIFIYKIQTGFTQKIQISTIVSCHQHLSAKCDMHAPAEAAASDASSAAVNKDFYRKGLGEDMGSDTEAMGYIKLLGWSMLLSGVWKYWFYVLLRKKKKA